MTHDELLAKLSNPINEGYEFCDIKYMKELRAVVKLHKPKTFIGEIPLPKKLSIVKCEGCKEHYPCPTIQAIEKELR